LPDLSEPGWLTNRNSKRLSRLILAWIIARASFEFSEYGDEDTGLEYHVDVVKHRVGWKDD
jgi:hypothetical protein